MIQYVIECLAFQLVFLIIYDVFLRRETFFQWNRWYLLGTCVLSFLLPLITLDIFKKQNNLDENLFEIVSLKSTLKLTQFEFIYQKYRDHVLALEYFFNLMKGRQ